MDNHDECSHMERVPAPYSIDAEYTPRIRIRTIGMLAGMLSFGLLVSCSGPAPVSKADRAAESSAAVDSWGSRISSPSSAGRARCHS